MAKVSAKPLSGFIELKPLQQVKFNEIVDSLKQKLEIFGFMPLDLPIIERQEVLIDETDKNETQNQMYLFEKGENKLGLRFDGTVGLARFVAGNANDLTFPFRRYQVGRNFRGERPQKGRYREFYQCDFDIIGENTLDSSYEFEIINLIYELFETLKPYVGDVIIKVGSRKILNEIFNYLDIEESVRQNILIFIDKKMKVSRDELVEMMQEYIGQAKAEKLYEIIEGDYKKLQGLTPELDEKIAELSVIADMIVNITGAKNVEFDLSIVRGLGYYTGVVFEVFLKNEPSLGSVCGGGRYDNLSDKFSSRKFVGVGGAIGVSRLFVPMIESGAIKLDKNLVDVVVIAMNASNNSYAQVTGNRLRDAGIKTIVNIDSSKFKKKLENANKLDAKYIVVIGDDEEVEQLVTLKNMDTGESEKISVNQVIEKLGK